MKDINGNPNNSYISIPDFIVNLFLQQPENFKIKFWGEFKSEFLWIV